MQQTLERLLDAANNHAEDARDMTCAVTDLRSLMHAAWEIMAPSQKRRFLQSQAVEDLAAAGGRGMFTSDSLDFEAIKELADKETAIRDAGYAIDKNADGFFWEHSGLQEASGCFAHREDAVVDAFEHAGHTH